MGKYGQQYELYCVNKFHNTSVFARWVYDLPGEICCFLRSAPRPKNFSEKFSKRRRLAGQNQSIFRSMRGKGENHQNPPRKGGEKMEATYRKFE